MIRYIRRSSIDTVKWDECIRKAAAPLIYAQSWYLDITCDHWDALVLDDYAAVMPVPYTRKMGISLALQPIFCQQLGVFSSSPVSTSLLNAFIEALPKRFRWVRLYLNYLNRAENLTEIRSNHVLDMTPDILSLRRAYHPSVVRNIRKSEKNGYRLSEEVDLTSIMDLFREQNREKGIGLNDVTMRRFEDILKTARTQGILNPIGLYSNEGGLCGVGVYLVDEKRVYYVLGATSEEGRRLSALFCIMDRLIEKKAGSGLILDFEGSQIEGVSRFFQKFGAENVPYPVLKREGLGPFNPILRKKFSKT